MTLLAGMILPMAAMAEDSPQLRTITGRQAAVNPTPMADTRNHEIALPHAPIASKDVHKTLAGKVAAILKEKTLRGTSIGIEILDLDTNDVVYAHDAQKVLKPASNTKLLTTAAALHLLGGDYQFESRLNVRGKIEKGVVEGDLQLFIDHDFTWSDRFYDAGNVPMRGLIAQLREAGVTRINGNLIVSGYVVYGGKATATLSTQAHLKQVANQFAALMKKNKIGFKSLQVRQSSKSEGKTVATWKSPMLSEAIVPLNRVSHNEYADMLLIAIGSKVAGKNTFEAGAKVVRDWLVKEGLTVKGFEQKDGSGLSHGNRMSAEFFTGLTRYMMKSRYAREWASSLSISGYDGTYGGRLAIDDGKGRVYAKSGTLRDTISGSGFFVNRHDGHTYAFSIIVNGMRNKKLTRQAIDRIVRVFLGDHLQVTLPATPQMQSFKKDESGQVVATWKSVKSVAGYRVYVSEDGNTWSEVHETDQTHFYFADRPAHVRVTSVDAKGAESDPSLIFSYRPGDRMMTVVEQARCRSDEAMRPANHFVAHERPIAQFIDASWGVETVRPPEAPHKGDYFFHAATCRGAIAWNASEYEKALKSDGTVIVDIVDAHLSADAAGACTPEDGKVLGCFDAPVVTKDRRIGNRSENTRLRKAAGTGSSRPSSIKTWKGGKTLFEMNSHPIAVKQKISDQKSIIVMGFDLQAMDSQKSLDALWKTMMNGK